MRRRFVLGEAVAILSRTPRTLDALLRGLPDGWIAANEGGGTWSPFDVVGHLIHGEHTDWVPRARIILEQGEARPFDRFDRFAQAAQQRVERRRGSREDGDGFVECERAAGAIDLCGHVGLRPI